MPIKSIKHLPIGAQKMWESVYKKAKESGKSESRSAMIAWEIVKKNYKSVKTVKTAVMHPSYGFPDSNYLKDVLIGYSQIDKDGQRLADSFWENVPLSPVKGDMEHIHKRKAEGEFVDYPEAWEDFIPIAENFKFKDGKMYADIELPKNHPFTPVFLENKDKYGVSVEYAYPEDAEEYQWEDDKLVPTITAGILTGWSFTEDPAIDTKEEKLIENE